MCINHMLGFGWVILHKLFWSQLCFICLQWRKLDKHTPGKAVMPLWMPLFRDYLASHRVILMVSVNCPDLDGNKFIWKHTFFQRICGMRLMLLKHSPQGTLFTCTKSWTQDKQLESICQSSSPELQCFWSLCVYLCCRLFLVLIYFFPFRGCKS